MDKRKNEDEATRGHVTRSWRDRLIAVAAELPFVPEYENFSGDQANEIGGADGEKRRARLTVRGLALAAVAFCLSRAPLLFSVNPLGAALLAAAECDVGWILVGLLLGLWQGAGSGVWTGAQAWLYAIAALGIFAVRSVCLFGPALQHEKHALFHAFGRFCKQFARKITRLWRRTECVGEEVGGFCEPLRLRVSVALAFALLPCFGVPWQGGFAFYDLCGSVLYLVATPLLVILLAGMWCPADGVETALWHIAGAVALPAFVCYGIRDVWALGVSPALALGAVLCLSMLRRYGSGIGGAVALVTAMAVDIKTVPLLLILTIGYSLLTPVIGVFAPAFALSAALLCALLTGGTTFCGQVAPSLVIGVLLDSAVSRLIASYLRKTQEQAAAYHDRRPGRGRVSHGRGDDAAELQWMCEQARSEALCARISAVAGAFGSLSELFRALGETLGRPDAAQIRMMLDEIFDEHCPTCAHKGRCWSDEYSETAEGVRALSRQLASKPGSSIVTCLPEGLRRRCPHIIEMLDELNYRIGRRTFEHRDGIEGEIFARSYDSIALLLRDILHEQGTVQDRQTLSTEKSEAVARWLEEHGMQVGHVCVSGERRLTIRIRGVSPAALTVSRDELQAALGQVCGVLLDKPRYDGSEDGCLIMHSLPRLRADYAHACCAAESGECAAGKSKYSRVPCGDTLRIFEGEVGMFYALLCDGMGSGRGAALTSGPAAMFLERVLQSGVSAGTALRMLNHYLRTRSLEDESSSTVDLFALDLYTGEARFIKCGAASSYVMRQGQVHRLTSHTVPLGILQTIDAHVLPYEVCEGDCILLMSDGVTDVVGGEAKENVGDWVTDFLAREDARVPDDSAMADLLIREARARGSDDDISVICIRIGVDY